MYLQERIFSVLLGSYALLTCKSLFIYFLVLPAEILFSLFRHFFLSILFSLYIIIRNAYTESRLIEQFSLNDIDTRNTWLNVGLIRTPSSLYFIFLFFPSFLQGNKENDRTDGVRRYNLFFSILSTRRFY